MFAAFAYFWSRANTARLWPALKAQGPPFHWVDFHATADPVSNGPLPADLASEPVAIHNRGSPMLDHTSYTSNPNEFIAGLVMAISKHTESSIPLTELTKDDADSICAAVRVRIWMVRLLVCFRWFVILTALIACVFNNRLVQTIGDWLSNMPYLATRCTPTTLGSLGVLAGAVAANEVFCALWNTAMKFQTQMLYQRSSGGSDRVFDYYFLLVAIQVSAVAWLASWPVVNHSAAPSIVKFLGAVLPVVAGAVAISKHFSWFTTEKS